MNKINDNKILIVDDIPSNLTVLLDYLSDEGYNTLVAEDGESALKKVNEEVPDLILMDIIMPGIDGFEACRQLKNNPETKDIPVIFMSSLSDTIDKVKGFEVGGVDYITKPFEHKEVIARVNTHLTLKNLQEELAKTNEELEKRVQERTADLEQALKEVSELKNQIEKEKFYLQEEIKLDHNFENIISESKPFQDVLRKVQQVALTDSTVLILGETGTGKELIARAVHDNSKRKSRSLVKVNCASLPANLIESELFGHEKGAFTGALQRKIGRFELANGGTIFLDEIGDLPLELQAKLLRVLQEGEFERLGNPNTLQVNTRVIAATNRDLNKAIADGEFRQDLFYRLNVFPIELPPLRERKDDIPPLVNHFIKKYSKKIGKNIERIPQNVIQSLENYEWPGNIRELENVIERAIILSYNETLSIDDTFLVSNAPSKEVKPTEATTLEDVERQHIENVLKECNWIIDGNRGAAQKLGLAASTLRDRMRKLEIKRPV